MKILPEQIFRAKKAFVACGAALLLSMNAMAVVYQAEDYTNFSDTSAGNTGGAYRGDGVDIEGSSDSGGGYNVGWIEANEWLAYSNLNIPTSGSYTIRMRVASPSGATAAVDLNGGTIQLGDFSIPATGGWQSWATVTRTVNINAGTYNLGVFAKTAGWNFNWIEVVSNGGGGSIATLYQHCNYGGWAAGFNSTGSFDLNGIVSRGGRNDDASSIRIAPGYEAVIYNDWNFSGSSVIAGGDTACLSNFNDLASSIVVRQKTTNNTGFAAVVKLSFVAHFFYLVS
ncbi:MAG: carbohydrate-binding protein, partial [Moraxellaceae bacterium]